MPRPVEGDRWDPSSEQGAARSTLPGQSGCGASRPFADFRCEERRRSRMAPRRPGPCQVHRSLLNRAGGLWLAGHGHHVEGQRPAFTVTPERHHGMGLPGGELKNCPGIGSTYSAMPVRNDYICHSSARRQSCPSKLAAVICGGTLRKITPENCRHGCASGCSRRLAGS